MILSRYQAYTYNPPRSLTGYMALYALHYNCITMPTYTICGCNDVYNFYQTVLLSNIFTTSINRDLML